MQKTIADAGTTLIIASKQEIANDLDYLAALIHARRSGMAEAERLDFLCHIRNLPEFFRTIFPDSDFKEALDFQRMSVHELISELSGFRAHMSGPGADLIDWTLVRFQVENLKVLIRECLTKAPVEELYGHLVFLPRGLALDIQGLTAAESPEEFVRLVPKGLLRENLERALKIYRDYPRPFFFEAALDRGYFQGLITRMEGLSREDLEIIKPMIYQEVDIFHLMLVARGKFHYGLAPEMLRPLHIAGTRIPRALFTAMLDDPDLYTSMGRAAQRVLDLALFEHGPNDGPMAGDVSALEGLAWKRFFCLANRAFRQSHMGLGAIMGYVGLRRVEVANLITISEGIRSGMAAETIRGHLIPRTMFAKGATPVKRGQA
jgi:vacuolar-type H+-ATPase subunit C/Vma6